MFLQVEGVAMGTPLGPFFDNLYLGTLEEKVFCQGLHPKPNIYCRYVDNIFIRVQEKSALEILEETFETHSCLKFSYESNRSTLFFLDTLVGQLIHN